MCFNICRVYVSVCSSMCLRVCTCACLRVLRYSCVFSLSLARSFSPILHALVLSLEYLSLVPFSRPSSLALSRLFHVLRHTHAHVLSAHLSLPSGLAFCNISRALSRDRRFAYFYGIKLRRRKLREIGTRDRTPSSISHSRGCWSIIFTLSLRFPRVRVSTLLLSPLSLALPVHRSFPLCLLLTLASFCSLSFFLALSLILAFSRSLSVMNRL